MTAGRLLAEKALLSGVLAAGVGLLLSACVGAFVHLDFARFELWVAALLVGGLAFGALGILVGALGRELSAASLLAFLVSLPVAFVALVPASAVSGAVAGVLEVVAFVFPFRATLQAADNAFTGAAPAIGLPLVHLLVLAVAYGVLARVVVRRFV